MSSFVSASLVHWPGGWTERDVGAALRVEDRLDLGALQSLPEVHRWADAHLDLFGQQRTQMNLTYEPLGEGDHPWLSFKPGDTHPVTIGGSTTVERVTSLQLSEDDDGALQLTGTARDLLIDDQEALGLAIKKMVDGTHGGRQIMATPVSSIAEQTTAPNCCPPVLSEGVDCSSGPAGQTVAVEEQTGFVVEDATFDINGLALSINQSASFPFYYYFYSWPAPGSYTVTVTWPGRNGIHALLTTDAEVPIDSTASPGPNNSFSWTFAVATTTDRLFLFYTSVSSSQAGTVELCAA